MEIDKTKTLILETIGIKESGVDLVDRVRALEKIDKNVSSVKLLESDVNWAIVSAQVCLKKNFAGIDEFKKYAEDKGLHGKITVYPREKVRYLIYNEGVEIEFYSL